MADLIDRGKFIASIQPWLDIECYNDGERNMLKCILSELAAAPSVEAEPVIRCKDCAKWMKSDLGNVCTLYATDRLTQPCDYCSHGIRKSGNAEPVRHGHWIYTPTNPLGFTCSECGKEMCRFNYCPHCGARMDGGT